jgi:LysM repeat protein
MILCKKSQSYLYHLILPLLIAFGFLVTPVFAYGPSSAAIVPLQINPDPYGLIAEVNALRAANGLSPLNPDPILMSIVQKHADYMASIRDVTHYSADGSRPFQRALAAGYPVAGDLSRGGFYSENIIAGQNLTPAEAVSRWTGDTPHLNTMLSPNFSDIGAGVSVVGSTVYYVIDASRKSGAAVPAYTPQSVNGTPVYNLSPLVSTIFPNTPMSDGSVIHVVKPGETLWLIAISYGMKINEILLLNNILKDSPIYPGQKLIIKAAVATLTPSSVPSFTPSRTLGSTATFSAKEDVLPTLSPGLVVSTNRTISVAKSFFILLAIILAALTIAALVAITSGRRKRN